MDEKRTVKHKSKVFALKIIEIYKQLCDEKKEYVMSKQLLKCGTSIGANIAESECAISKREFAAKLYIALKECNETRYWLELLYESKYLDKNVYDSTHNDCEEILRMLNAATKTTVQQLNK